MYKLKYIQELTTLEKNEHFAVGTALHTALEKGLPTAVEEFYNSYNVIDDNVVNEVIKLHYLVPKVQLPQGGMYEYRIDKQDFIGYIDYIVQNENGKYDIYDFKYSNNKEHYLNSPQLHLYKYYADVEIENLFYVFVPKTYIRQKQSETIFDFRQRLIKVLKELKVDVVKVDYDSEKINDFLNTVNDINQETEFEKTESKLCDWCEFKNYCQKGIDYMILPSNERRKIEPKNTTTRLWIYGVPFSGKTTFANAFPNPLLINTDGNYTRVDAPAIHIKDKIDNPRINSKTLAWVMFKDVITELEKKDNKFETIIIDLLEDLYEHCRVYIYDKMGISHESDNPFSSYDKIRTEFLNVIKRLMNLDYKNIVLISHEDTSKEITKMSGDKISSIRPMLAEKVANKVAGMVDMVGRVVVNGDSRTLSFKGDSVVFGGGRLNVSGKIPLNVEEFLKLYNQEVK